jgi:hypothetical protein
LRINQWKNQDHSASFQYFGWKVRPSPLRLPVAGKAFFLTSPFNPALSRVVLRARADVLFPGDRRCAITRSRGSKARGARSRRSAALDLMFRLQHFASEEIGSIAGRLSTPSSGMIPRILGSQSLRGSPHRRGRQHFGHFSGCAGQSLSGVRPIGWATWSAATAYTGGNVLACFRHRLRAGTWTLLWPCFGSRGWHHAVN